MIADPQARRRARRLWVVLFCLLALLGTVRDQAPSTVEAVAFARDVLAGEASEWRSGVDRLLAVVHAPVLLAVRIYEVAGGGALPFSAHLFWSQITTAALLATAGSLVFRSGIVLGFSRAASLAAALLAAVASPLLLGPRLDGTAVLETAILSGTAYALFASVRSPTTLPYLAAGWLTALLLATGLSHVLVLGWCIVFAISVSRNRQDRGLALASFVISLGFGFAVLESTGLLARDAFVFAAGWRPLHEAVPSEILSPSFGVLVFWPAAVLLFPSLPGFVRRRGPEAALIAGFVLAVLVRAAAAPATEVSGWGPTGMLPAIPLLSLYLLPLLDGDARLRRAAFGTFAFVGIAAQVLPLAYGFRTHVLPVWDAIEPERRETLIDDPAVAPLRVAALWLTSDVTRHLPPYEEPAPWNAPESFPAPSHLAPWIVSLARDGAPGAPALAAVLAAALLASSFRWNQRVVLERPRRRAARGQRPPRRPRPRRGARSARTDRQATPAASVHALTEWKFNYSLPRGGGSRDESSAPPTASGTDDGIVPDDPTERTRSSA